MRPPLPSMDVRGPRRSIEGSVSPTSSANDGIDGMDVPALKALKVQVDSRIAELNGQERREAFLELEKFAAELGLDVSDLRMQYGNGGNDTSDAEVKYRNPETGETWCGRGRRPNWVREELAKGRKLEEFAT